MDRIKAGRSWRPVFRGVPEYVEADSYQDAHTAAVRLLDARRVSMRISHRWGAVVVTPAPQAGLFDSPSPRAVRIRALLSGMDR